MKILELYILKKLFVTFVAAEIVYSLIFFIQNLFILSSLIVEKHSPIYESLLLILYMLPKTIAYTIPFSVIFSGLFVTFKMASTSELVAINSSGIELKTQQKPYVVFAFFITLLYAFMVFYLLPFSKQKRDNLINKINIRSVIYSLNSGEFNKISDSFYIYAQKTQKNIFENVIAFNYINFNDFKIIFSKKAMLNLNEKKLSLALKFFNGKEYLFSSKKTDNISESTFGKKILVVSINPDLLIKKDSEKAARDKFTLKKLVYFLKNKDKIAISIFLKRLLMILFVFISPLLGFYIGFTLKRGAVISGAIVYGFIISFFYVILLNIFVNLLQHNIFVGSILIFALLLTLVYFTFVNKEKIEKPLVVKERKSVVDFLKNKMRRIQYLFENSFIRKIEEKELVSIKFPLLIRYVVLNFLKTFLLFFVILQGVYLLTITLKIIVNLFKYKGNILSGLKFILYSTLAVYPLIIPFSFLIAALFYFISLEDNNEITAIKASGISIYSIIVPIGYISLIFSIVLLFFTTLFSPLSSKKSSILYSEINARKKSIIVKKLKLKNSSVIRSLTNKNGFYWCDYYDFQNGEFINFISLNIDFSDGNLKEIYKAEKIFVKNDTVKGKKNDMLISRNANGTYLTLKNPDKVVIWDNLSYFKEIEPSPEEMTQFELRKYISRKKAIGIKPYKFITNYYYRLASAFSPLILLLFGLPLALGGEGRKKKPITGVGLGLVLVIIYYIITSLSLSFGAKHYLPSFFAAWLTNLLFALTGLYLFTKIKT
ncbi:lipopolysaccharide export system permease protein [Thermotomaculum hydrothermale]|uniref:Lipopolysaccharide export system permease protein n=1 Tax=Thermotomaculum hydrothermale TaxID=981385 RepID=A0A7R6PQH1_9BACT|nr:LptF/LptG family permease [Thermotomaculum hydrothermale]BBB32486.1 lipopolysaccharide export system permease protein [Thermotomaculum hydrothermale]